MTKTIALSMCLAISALLLNARAQQKEIRAQQQDNARAQQQDKDKLTYSNGPVTLVNYIHVEYGHFEDYMAWVTSTWVPTMEAEKKAGLIIGYKVFRAEPKSPDQPNVYLEITYKNMAAY